MTAVLKQVRDGCVTIRPPGADVRLVSMPSGAVLHTGAASLPPMCFVLEDGETIELDTTYAPQEL